MTSRGRPFKKGEVANPDGRPKGSLNRYTRLRNDILDAVEVMAKKYGKQGTAEYLGDLCKTDPVGFLRVAASLLPKHIKAEVIERVNISLEGDEDCDKSEDA